MRVKRLAMAAALLAVSPMVLKRVAHAQQVVPPDDRSGAPEQYVGSSSFKLSPVEVHAPANTPETKRQSLEYPTTSISRDQFEELPNQRLGDVLQRLPGVTMGGAPGERKDVRLRGLDKEFTRTQFDGVMLTDGGEKREFQVFRFPSFLVGNVSVIRNPTAEFEADGIAGRIDVKLRDIPRERKIEVETGAGGGSGLSFGDDRSFKGAYGQRFGNLGLQLGYSNQADPIVKDKSKLVLGGNTELENEKKDLMFNDVFADFAWFGERNKVHVKPIFLNLDENKDKTKRTFKPTGILDKTELETGDELKRTIAVIVDHIFEGASGLMVNTKFAFSRTTENKDKDKIFLKGNGSLDKRETEQENKKDETFELGSKVTLPFQVGVSNTLKFGGIFRRRNRFRDKNKLEIKNGKTTNKTSPKDNFSIDEYFFAGFVQDTIRLTDDLSITPGLRYEHVIRDPVSGAGVSGRDTISDVLPSVHLVYRPNKGTALRASVSRQVNRPKFDDLAPFQDEKPDKISEGNPNLKPARAWSFDVGGDYTSKNLFFGLNLFHRQVKDVIDKVDTGIDIGGKDLERIENVGDGYVQGIELEQRVRFAILGVPALENFSVRANQTLIRSALEDKMGQTKPFKQQPSLIANVSIVYERPESGTIVSLSGNYVSDTSNDDAVKTDTTNKEFFLDFYAETRVYGNVSIFGWVRNITGEAREKIKIEGAKTEIMNETTGRSFFVGLKARLP